MGDAQSVAEIMLELGRKARAAAGPLAIASPAKKNAALITMADALLRRKELILQANHLDVAVKSFVLTLHAPVARNCIGHA